MLGYVHAGIGDANNIFHGKPVYGKASHAKAAGNVLFLKHGISRYPQAQALGQYLRLFDSGFRHQDNEFVPAVASHYIRLPALLLKEPANASQHQIAFQMPLRVIDLFKLIQVHQHDRKWTARAGCPLPLGVQGLPEEAAGLYASLTIGNPLQQQSITDGLTGIKPRRFFWEALNSEWKRASRSGRPFSVVLMDLDKFKEVNDTKGHLEGDLVLARVGRLLEQKCRQSNVVARYGGDEFIILMPETGVEQAQILAERLRLWISTDPMLQEQHITGSFGVGSFPVHGFSVEDIIRVADAGMYVSKHKGGDRVSTAEEFADGETAAVQRQLISGYIEGFLQREHTGPEHLEELLTTLKKMCGDDEGRNFVVLREAIETLTRAAESRELNCSGHGEMVAHYCETIARSLRLTSEDVADLVYAARVHDVGKIFVPERTLNKSGPLTDDEFYILKMHSRVGGEILATIPGSENIQKAVEHHHEAFDGGGYPARLRGEEIPLWARIIAIADAYVNMTTDRSFATAKTSEQALNELEKLSGTRYDGMLVRILLRELKQEKASSSLSG